MSPAPACSPEDQLTADLLSQSKSGDGLSLTERGNEEPTLGHSGASVPVTAGRGWRSQLWSITRTARSIYLLTILVLDATRECVDEGKCALHANGGLYYGTYMNVF